MLVQSAERGAYNAKVLYSITIMFQYCTQNAFSPDAKAI